MTKNLEGFSVYKSEIETFLRPKTRGDLQKNKTVISKKTKQKKKVFTEIVRNFPAENRSQTLIWASICTPVAPSLLISSGHSPRLGGHSFHLGGHSPEMPPGGAGPDR